MKRYLAGMCVICLLFSVCLANGTAWTDEEWAAVCEALLTEDLPQPVPEAFRVTAQPVQRNAWDGSSPYFDFLMLSTDASDVNDHYGRTGALMICRIGLGTGEIRVLSLPDEAMVKLDELPEPIYLRFVNCFGGPALTVQTLNQALDLNISRYCSVNIASFMSIVEALGGVWMKLTAEEAKELKLTEGEHLLNGKQAITYVMLREEGDSLDRMRALMEVVLRQTLTSGSLSSILKMMDSFLPAIDSNLSIADLVNVAYAALTQESKSAFETKALLADADNTLGEEARRNCHAYLDVIGE